jgi:V8-like Glu-specific endopeptidase
VNFTVFNSNTSINSEPICRQQANRRRRDDDVGMPLNYIRNRDHVAKSKQYPWHAAIVDEGTTVSFCGGTLISPRVVISGMEKQEANKDGYKKSRIIKIQLIMEIFLS